MRAISKFWQRVFGVLHGKGVWDMYSVKLALSIEEGGNSYSATEVVYNDMNYEYLVILEKALVGTLIGMGDAYVAAKKSGVVVKSVSSKKFSATITMDITKNGEAYSRIVQNYFGMKYEHILELERSLSGSLLQMGDDRVAATCCKEHA